MVDICFQLYYNHLIKKGKLRYAKVGDNIQLSVGTNRTIYNTIDKKDTVMKKVNLISAEDCAIALYAGEDFVGKSSYAPWLAAMIVGRGGPADTIMASSSCFYATEYGFESQNAFDNLWGSVCGIL